MLYFPCLGSVLVSRILPHTLSNVPTRASPSACTRPSNGSGARDRSRCLGNTLRLRLCFCFSLLLTLFNHDGNAVVLFRHPTLRRQRGARRCCSHAHSVIRKVVSQPATQKVQG